MIVTSVGCRLLDYRLVAVPPQLDPRNLADMRAAPAFGPRGLLLVGFSEHDCAAVRSWFQQMEAGFVVAPCPAALLASGTLGDALGSADGGAAVAMSERPWEAPPAGGLWASRQPQSLRCACNMWTHLAADVISAMLTSCRHAACGILFWLRRGGAGCAHGGLERLHRP